MTASLEFGEDGLRISCLSSILVSLAEAAPVAIANVEEAGGGTEEVIRSGLLLWFMSLPKDVYLTGEE